MSKPPILLNFIALKSGGGVQVGLDFLSHINTNQAYEWHLVVTKGTAFDSVSVQDGFASVHRVDNGIWGRIKAELIILRNLARTVKPIAILTLFGPAPIFILDQDIKTISGCAYSNLFYPEINFWKNSGVFLQWRNRILDVFRLFLTRRADLVIFETEDLRDRSISIRGFEPNQSVCIMPAVSTKITDLKESSEYSEVLAKIDGFKIVLISYYRYHKNIDILPHVLDTLKKVHDIHDVRFILTTEPSHPGTIALLELAKKLGVHENLHNLGPIPPQHCGQIYRCSNASILPSTLESFSNNIAESWACSIPLIITDRSWARSICREAALYIKYRDIADTAEKIAALRRDSGLQESLVEAGKERLAQYPTSKQRFDAYIKTLNEITATTARRVNA